MSDEKEQAVNNPLANRVNAAPFVPGRGIGSSSSANVNAKPFVPSPSRMGASPTSFGAEAKPFVPGLNGMTTSVAGGRISASAAAFVPGGGGVAKSPTMSLSAPAFVPRSSPGSEVNGRGLGVQAAEQRLPEGDDLLGMTAHYPFASDLRSTNAHGMPGPIPLGQVRPGAQAFALNSFARRGKTPPPANAYGGSGVGKGGRLVQGRAYDAGGRGRGRSPLHAQSALFPGQVGFQHSMSRLAQAQHSAAAMAERLILQLQSQSYMYQAQMPPEMQAETGLPDMVQQYHSLYPLEDFKKGEELVSNALGVQTLVFKGISMQDGQAYALRRINWRQVQPTPELLAHANEVAEAWGSLGPHPNLSVPRHVFVSLEFGGQPALYISHDYCSAAVTLEAAHLQPQVTANGLVQVAVTEDALWRYLIQLAACLRAVHSVGLACRAAMHPSKVLLLPGGRIRMGSLGVAEIIAGKAARQDDVGALQREDLLGLGRLLLQLACSSPQHPSLEYCAAHFSRELTRTVAALLGLQESISSWHQLTAALGEQAFGELDSQHLYCDAVTAQLANETENGRLLRVLAKLSMITERSDMDTQWAETGDRYLLKLFRDFVFHQCTEEGAPILDWGHVAECLNKLDAGVPEKIVLLSRDEASMLVVSYADLKRCIESTFGDLRKQAYSARMHAERPRTPT